MIVSGDTACSIFRITSFLTSRSSVTHSTTIWLFRKQGFAVHSFCDQDQIWADSYLFDYASSCPVRIEMLICSHCGAGTATYLRDACLFSQTVISNVLPKIKTPPIIASEVNFSFSQIAAMGTPKNVIK